MAIAGESEARMAVSGGARVKVGMREGPEDAVGGWKCIPPREREREPQLSARPESSSLLSLVVAAAWEELAGGKKGYVEGRAEMEGKEEVVTWLRFGAREEEEAVVRRQHEHEQGGAPKRVEWRGRVEGAAAGPAGLAGMLGGTEDM